MDHDHQHSTPSDTDIAVTIVFVIVLVATLLMWSGGGTRIFERDTTTTGTIEHSAAPDTPPGSPM
jgi:hypothetical protein